MTTIRLHNRTYTKNLYGEVVYREDGKDYWVLALQTWEQIVLWKA